MNRIINIICLTAALVAGLCGCQKPASMPGTQIDLRYRVADSYDLPASNAQSFSIVVTSSDPWTVTSEHPDWCIIDIEEGDASDPANVRIGKGDKTTIRVQYYDNLGLDDRTDHIEIRSGSWLGKRVTVNQKGIAYLNIPEEELSIDVTKAGGEVQFHIFANQDWSTAVTDGDWLSITDGATGSGDGTVTITAVDNPGEKRYAVVNVYDRHGVEAATINLTQDGAQLDPATLEIRAGYDQHAATLDVIANSRWKAMKDNEGDTWYNITNPENDGDATLELTLTDNPGEGLRIGHIILQSVSDDPDAYMVERIITVKQAYRIAPVRVEFDNDEMGRWESDKGIDPIYTKGVGTLFQGGGQYARLHNGEMPFGTYTFRWSNLTGDARIRHWFCYGDGQEIKYNITSGKISLDFNTSSAGISGKPEISGIELDTSVPHEYTLKFDPSGANYCHVTYLLDGVEFASFDSSDTIMHKVLWGEEINMYVGVDTGGSAICEWYEYTAPVNWED